jgi:hypothetical protein
LCRSREIAEVIQLPTGTKIWVAAGVTDMRRGFDELSAQVQTVLQQQPFSGHVFCFLGQRGDREAALVGWRWSLSFRQFTGFTLHRFRVDAKVLILSGFEGRCPV